MKTSFMHRVFQHSDACKIHPAPFRATGSVHPSKRNAISRSTYCGYQDSVAMVPINLSMVARALAHSK